MKHILLTSEMTGGTTVFENLKELSSELEQNMSFLEFEVSDATKLLYNSENKLKTDSKGISILQEILKQHTIICEKLEKFSRDEESDLAALNEELDTFTTIMNEREKEQEELENKLIDRNLIQPEQSVISINDLSNDREQNSHVATSSSPQPPASCDSTFLIPPPKQAYFTQTPDFQSTVCEFGYGNSSSKINRKTFKIKNN